MQCRLVGALAFALACGKPGRGERIGDPLDYVDNATIDRGELFAMAPAGLMKLSLVKGTREYLTAPFPPPVIGLAVTRDEVLWGDWASSEGGGAIRAVSRQGGPVRTLATGQGRPSHLWTDGSEVYWSTMDFTPPENTARGALRSVAISGGNVVTRRSVDSAGFQPIGADATRVFFNQVSVAAYFGGTPAESFVGAIAKDGTGGVERFTSVDVWSWSWGQLIGSRIFWIAAGPPPAFQMLDLNTRTSTVIRAVDVGFDWVGVDARGGFTSSEVCKRNGAEEDPNATVDCSSWLRRLDSGEAVAYADWFVQGFAMDDTYVYWSVTGRGFYRVRR